MFTSQYGTNYQYFIEVIEKEVLLNHLRDERMLMEDIRNGALSLTLK